jgi:hypothetical protein
MDASGVRGSRAPAVPVLVMIASHMAGVGVENAPKCLLTGDHGGRFLSKAGWYRKRLHYFHLQRRRPT